MTGRGLLCLAVSSAVHAGPAAGLLQELLELGLTTRCGAAGRVSAVLDPSLVPP